MNNLLLACIVSFLPIAELRVGLPLALSYALKNDVSILFVFFLIVFVNLAAIFFVFFILDFFHHKLEKFSWYRRGFELWLKKTQKKIDRVESKDGVWAFTALALFVAVPLPGTGAWTGSIIAWTLGLDRKTSIIAIAAGVLAAGILILLGTFGFVSLFNILG